MSVAPPVDSTVPRIAGPMPGPTRREITGISLVKKSGKAWNATPAWLNVSVLVLLVPAALLGAKLSEWRNRSAA